jgi:hypothetical protein
MVIATDNLSIVVTLASRASRVEMKKMGPPQRIATSELWG